MRIIKRKSLLEFWAKHPDSEQALKAWFTEVEKATWKNSDDVKRTYRYASIINSDRVVFNICGNKYRLIVSINYPVGVVYVKFVGTHSEYDRIDAEAVKWKQKS